ncbi:MAG TPA: DJ-1 family protein [Clostridiales bacterium]|nr:DJ-1 family protein [Clostridiales bacterium]
MIYVLLAEGFEEIEALTPVDMLRRAGYEVRTVGITGKTVTGAHGIPVVADLTADEAGTDGVRMVVLPGGMPGTKNLAASPFVKEILAKVHASGGILAAICAAPTVLAKFGYLKGKRATCFPGFEKELSGAVYTDLPAVTDGKIVTGKDMTEALAFSVALLAILNTAESHA